MRRLPLLASLSTAAAVLFLFSLVSLSTLNTKKGQSGPPQDLQVNPFHDQHRQLNRRLPSNFEQRTLANLSSRPDLEAFLSLQKERRERVSKVCRRRRQNHHEENASLGVLSEMYFHPRRRLLWCPVYKAASTNWLHNFVALDESKTQAEKDALMEEHEGRVNEVADVLYRQNDTLLLPSTWEQPMTGFVIVRHPFHRLVSAYRDKLERIDPDGRDGDYYYKLYGINIVDRYRPATLNRFGWEFFSGENNFGSPLKVSEKRGWRDERLPTFWEFVQYILDESPYDYDIHWSPTSIYCEPCQLHFDFILKFEDVDTEEPKFKELAGLTDALPADPSWSNKNSPDGMAQEELTASYFAQLDLKDVTRLFRVYEADFRMFGYRFTFERRSFPPDFG